ncbi:MAG: glutamate synthase subunit alpha, partial [Verrucomicrobiales bacterium]|nr:glutamate synthase subunit alpha [Verrucomicrobiales bacterium]
LCGGVKMVLTGEANDYVGKGMCGGEIVIKPREGVPFEACRNSIAGNTVMYGASGGAFFAAGRAGERFCVRNSGGTAVVEGIGDHGCEYMTNGVVLVLGKTGKNFGAGMSGGVAYVLDAEQQFEKLYNPEMITAEPLADAGDIDLVKGLIRRHCEETGSVLAKDILADWDAYLPKFIKVRPSSPPTPPAYDAEEEAGETAGAAAEVPSKG